MRITEAIELARKKKKKIGSKSCRMFQQTAKTLIHWLLADRGAGPRRKIHTMLDILEATDWKLEK